MAKHGTYAEYQQHKLRGEKACRKCLEANRAYKRANQSAYMQNPAHRERQRWYQIRYQHGLTKEQFFELLAAQGNGCAICRRPEPGGQGFWHVDHVHACCPTSNGRKKSCGRCVRGLLCAPCNMALGLFLDDPVRMQAAIDYI